MNKIEIEDLPYEQYGNVKVISICDWINSAYGDSEPDIEICIRDFKEWLKSHSAIHYYARSREHFFIREGIAEAIRSKKGMVLIEDLS